MSTTAILSQYWGLIACFIGGVVYVLLHRSISLAYAKKKAVSLMFLVEKRAENFCLTEGTDKLKWVTENGYDLLPSGVRLIVSKPLFQMIAQEAFDAIVGLANKYNKNVPAAPVVTPSPVIPIPTPAPQPQAQQQVPTPPTFL